MLVDFLLSRQRIARYLFNSFRQPANLKKVLQARPSVCGEMCWSCRQLVTCCDIGVGCVHGNGRHCFAATVVLLLSMQSCKL